MTRSGRPGPPRRRSVARTLLVLLAVALVVVLVLLLLWYLLAGRLTTPGPGEPQVPGAEPPTSQPASCPDVFVLSVPGTWESNAADDPYAPTANPISLMLNVTQPLQQQFGPERAEVYTVPYVAQFSNPIAFPPDGQASYNVSRSEGAAKANEILAQRSSECPLTSYVLAGFSQGAVIVGDLAASIGAGAGPVPAERVLGVTVIADGRRDGTSAQQIGPPVDGVGAEVALGGLDVPGITMTGARQGGFGALADRTFSICAPGDLICAAPPEAMSLRNIPSSLTALAGAAGNPVHGNYARYVVDDAGTTATQWTANWAAGLVASAPTPAHS
ncbi:cutinase family protein [Rhodococcus sp. BP-149]|uniref:cutinase family protein n=1 Tax=unclassified Rhodococcus (in: high G+C Gram-positive bacteria) TaxID=192944 RepID=UPI0009DE95D4|nr:MULTISPECIES: cutinase family protein [unclassified Rhodococcus (in: high G+C Gram-positive bacteria)]MBY6678299.1 cutinase family protein [Rhodococcus sp. BP-332]MBY6683603.1 cutinase family protein [Rhodococcus sp. BP-316]MBY6687725.1 cutinase family protein [Rhodococcus sp. BP-288]MBY6695880.1 cutinase family protein [Rhodococcus sp. BP-188]MBY6700312.1 cutinase family protein [Rhodococcus sp. BP-285]